MKKMMMLLLSFALILSLSSFADQVSCTDSDGGGEDSKDSALEVFGTAKYGLTPTDDTCLTASDGVSTNSSTWLKEYYCTTDTPPKRNSETYDCVKLGYEKCKDGACIGKPAAQTTTTAKKQEVACGNKLLEKDKGEECDPPGSICFGRTSSQYGSCQANCKCKISASAQKPEVVCGDSYRDEGEACEEDAHCPTNYVCSSCNCVKELTPEEIASMKDKTKTEEQKEAEETKKEIDEKYPTSEPEVEGKDFTEEPGIQATSGIANFFKKIFSWIGNLFS